MAGNHAETIGFALARLAAARSTFTADADQADEDSRQVLEVTSSGEVKAALQHRLITKKQLSDTVLAAKQAIETMRETRTVQDRNFAQLDTTLRHLADRIGPTRPG